MESNSELIDYLERKERIRTERVGEAFRAVDRKLFVPEEYSSRAYEDTPLPIGEEATISAPHMVAINTELLDSGADDSVLEIGSGSGYQLSILAELTEKKVVGVERVEELAQRSSEALESWGNTEVIHGNGLEAVDGDFDRILFSCAVKCLSDAKDHLPDDGIIVAPVEINGKQVLKKYTAKKDRLEDHGSVRFVPYRDGPV